MSQVYDKTKPISGTTTFGQLYQILRDHADAAATLFSGTVFPTVVAADAGRPCFRTDRLTAGGVPKLYIYTGLPALGESGWVEISANSPTGEEVITARGTKPTLDQRMDVALNEDGTLKASTTLNPSQWYKPTGWTWTYLSTTSFKVAGDQTDIYKATRRLKVNLAASTAYTEVVSASYSAPDTTIQVLDAVLDATLVDVEHSLHLPDKDNGAITSRMVGRRRIKSIVFADSPYTATIHDEIILVDASGGAVTINAPAAATMGAGRRQEIIKTDSSANAVTIDPNGSETINGNATYAITVPLTGVEYESDGSNLRTINDASDKLTAEDIVQDHVVSGLLGSDPGASLSMTIPAGIAYVIGRRVVKLTGASDLTHAYTASKDTYVDISHTGAITYSEVANGAGAPSVAANSLRLMKVVTNATEITGVTDLRTIAGVKSITMNGEASAAGTGLSTTINLGNVKAGDRILLSGFLQITSTTQPTYPFGSLAISSGTATAKIWSAQTSGDYAIVAVSSTIQKGSGTVIMEVTGDGTLTIANGVTYTGGVNVTLVNEVYAVFLRKQ